MERRGERRLARAGTAVVAALALSACGGQSTQEKAPSSPPVDGIECMQTAGSPVEVFTCPVIKVYISRPSDTTADVGISPLGQDKPSGFPFISSTPFTAGFSNDRQGCDVVAIVAQDAPQDKVFEQCEGKPGTDQVSPASPPNTMDKRV